ncbi:SRPBCC family protein [Neobacillus niacini]|uniref:SRPBCC family protein n=1 Tax=Neobacillus niacini TaxID=86668 RepID=UPI0039830990
MNTNEFVYVTYIAATPQKVWEALTSSEYTEKYFFGSSIQSHWQEGSEITYSRNGKVSDYGQILRCDPYRELSFTWTYAGDGVQTKEPSKVTFRLISLNETVKLVLHHENLQPGDLVDKEDTFEGLNNGWPAILSNLKSLLETGRALPAITI